MNILIKELKRKFTCISVQEDLQNVLVGEDHKHRKHIIIILTVTKREKIIQDQKIKANY